MHRHVGTTSGDNGAGGTDVRRIANDVAADDGVTHGCTPCELVAVRKHKVLGSAHSEPG